MTFVKWMDRINHLINLLLGIALGIMTLSVFLQVIVRFILPSIGIHVSVPWTEELARYLMIWTVFIGGAVAARHSKLLAVDALVVAVPTVPGKIMKTAAYLLSLCFYIFILIIGLEWSGYGLKTTSPVMGIPMFYIYLSMVLGGLLLILNTVALLIDVFLNKKDIREPYAK